MKIGIDWGGTKIEAIAIDSKDGSELNRIRIDSPKDNYKEIIHITKFERDTFKQSQSTVDYQSNMSSYEFVNIWPTNLTSMRVAYGDSNVLKCSVQFAYDRFFTRFNYDDSNRAVVNTPRGLVNSNDRVKGGQGGLPLGTTTLRNDGVRERGTTPYINPATNYRNRKRGSGAR